MGIHRKWVSYLGYFDPIDKSHKNEIKKQLANGKNILIMIKKSEDGGRDRQKEIFDEFCEIFPSETKIGRIIISAVPDIVDVINER